MRPITEEEKLHDQWYKDANKVNTLDEFRVFTERLLGEAREFEHDYGTVCHAISAVATAAAWMANRMPGARGGITGFQSGCVMWGFLRGFMSLKGDMRLVQYENLLYPQYEHDFEKTISGSTWANLQSAARTKLSGTDPVHPDVRAHWQSIADGRVPFGFAVRD